MTGSAAGTNVTRIAEELRRQILSGDIPGGAPLREKRLAERFAVSRHTVRTALAHLTGTGLAEALPNRGVRVAEFDATRATALQDLRRAIEIEAVEILHRHHGSAWPDRVRAPIETAIDRLAHAERAGDDGVAVLQAHSAVHAALVAAAASPRLIDIHVQLLDEMNLLLLHARTHYEPGELEGQHRQLLASVQSEGAPAIRQHLDDTLSRMTRRDEGNSSES